MADLPLIDNDSIVFAGDSIVAQYKWSHYLSAYLHLRNPSLHLRTVVIGHGGSPVDNFREISAANRQYYPKECQSLDPTYVFIEFGHNDASDSKATYKSNMTALVNDFVIGKNSAVPVFIGCNPKATVTGTPRIGEFDDANQEIIDTLGFGYCNKLWQQLKDLFTNSANWAAIGGADDTHPGTGGNIAMFFQTILGFGWSVDVSQAVINGNNATLTSQSDCTISSISLNAFDGVDFTRLDNRLPWVIDEGGRADALLLYPNFANAQDYTLTVTGLPVGNYEINIDGELVASVSDAALAAGWNMSDLTTGPIFDQCQDVLNKIRDLQWINRTTLIPITPPPAREGVELYKSNAGVQYGLGLRDEPLQEALSVSLANIAAKETIIHTAKQPIARSFSLRRIGSSEIAVSRRQNKLRHSGILI